MTRTSGYRNNIKQDWRDNVWQDIADHCRETDGYILTLAGKSFLDRKSAVRHGISADRVIGVDTDQAVEAHNKKFKRTVICRPLHKVIAHFNRPIAAINADLCCNMFSPLCGDVIRNWMISPYTKNALLVLNVAVGRETNKCVIDELGNRKRADFLTPDLNRAMGALHWWAPGQLLRLFKEQNGQSLKDATQSDWTIAYEYVFPLLEKSLVAAGQYVAHVQRMDSIVVRQFIDWSITKFQDDDGSKGHIAAKMAHHTMRHKNE